MNCLFCSDQEQDRFKSDGSIRKYKPPPNTDFICSQCVQLLLMADQGDLKKAHTKAIEKGLDRKARALESFIEEGRHYGKTKNSKRNMARKRPLRTARPTRH